MQSIAAIYGKIIAKNSFILTKINIINLIMREFTRKVKIASIIQ